MRKIFEKLDETMLETFVREINSYDGSFQDYEYYDLDELDELLHSVKPSEIIRMCHFGEFNYMDGYFRINVYGNLESVSQYEYIEELKEIKNELIEQAISIHERDDTYFEWLISYYRLDEVK